MKFEWDPKKETENVKKHGVDFSTACRVFKDNYRVTAKDITHSIKGESRYYCFGKVDGGILTVRFTYRRNRIRIFGAGYWRKGKNTYEKENKIH